MDDDLPVDIDTDSGGDDGGTDLWKWVAGAGGAIVGIYVLAWLFQILVGVVGFLAYYGMIALLVYGAYRGVKYMLSDDTTASSTTDQQVALPDDVDVDSELDSELGDLEEGGGLDGDLEGELEGVTLDDSELGGDIDEVETSVDRDMDDDELERKFAELEKEMNDS